MADKLPISVFLAPDLRLAAMLAEWLISKGVGADVQVDMPAPDVDPVTGATTIRSPSGVHVVVTDPAKEEEAKQLLADRAAVAQAARERDAARANRTGTVTAECEECGESSDWPATEMGTTQDCPHCGKYMDVPDPDEQWDDADYADEESVEAGETPDEKQES